jgi:MFS family permease
VVLVLEALTIAFVNWILGLAVRHQEMSLAGLDPDAMAAGSWVGGGLFALFLIACAVLTARIALRDRMSGRFGRIVLIVCAVVHGVVGAVVVGLVGWYAFVLLMLILGLLVGTLLLYAPEDQPAASAATPPAAPGEPATSTGP